MQIKFDYCFLTFCRVLDEHEMYTEQKLFQLNDFVMLTYFLNNILYKIINEDIFGKRNDF